MILQVICLYTFKPQTTESTDASLPRITDGRSDLLPNPSQNLRSVGAGHLTWVTSEPISQSNKKKPWKSQVFHPGRWTAGASFPAVLFVVRFFFKDLFILFFPWVICWFRPLIFQGVWNFACTAQSHTAKVGSELLILSFCWGQKHNKVAQSIQQQIYPFVLMIKKKVYFLKEPISEILPLNSCNAL